MRFHIDERYENFFDAGHIDLQHERDAVKPRIMIDEILRADQAAFLAAKRSEEQSVMSLSLAPHSRQLDHAGSTGSVIIRARDLSAGSINMPANDDDAITHSMKNSNCHAAGCINRAAWKSRFGNGHHIGGIRTEAFEFFNRPLQRGLLVR